ncbi:MAG: DUF1048 domain-containing protein [Eubacteriaceae bacterium]
MNFKGKNKIFMSIGLTILLILQIIFFINVNPQSRNPLGIIFATIIFLALFAVYINWIAVKKIEKRIKNLPESYKDVYIHANEYIGMSNMKRTQKKEIMTMILEIFEHAHLDNRNVEEVIGKNLDLFMKNFIEAAGGNTSFGYLFGYSSALYIIYLFFMKLYKVLKTGSFTFESLYNETLDIGIILMYGLIAFVFFPWLLLTMQKASKERWNGIKRGLILIPFLIPFGLVGVLIFVKDQRFINFIDTPVALFSSVNSIIIGTVLLLGSILLMKYSQRKNFRRSL